MIRLSLIWLLITLAFQVNAQEQQNISKFYLGLAYGKSYTIGDFGNTDLNNPNAGFAKNGQRFDVYGGYFLDIKGNATLTGVFRYQTFKTEIEDIIADLKANEPNLELTGNTEDWRVCSLLFGLAYKVDIGSKFALFPRLGMGPIWATTPGMAINAPNALITQKFNRSSETGLGLGYELGLGLKRDLGRYLVLMPTFTFSGGIVSINDLVTSTDNIIATRNYRPTIQSFNLGLSFAYRIY